MRKFLSTLLMLLAATWLAGCGESGGFTNTVSISVSITPEQTTVPANILNVEPALGSPYTVHVPVRVMRENDTPVADGTNVNMTVSGVQHGLLSVATETPEDFVNTDETINQETTGGIAHFYFTSTSIPGQATLTASVVDPASGQTITKSAT
ncbi:MAG: hypothetical protein PHQ14_02130, partial [Chromatiales bacterium]|nr:hypothetical protein [Chromatiales bacterium]